MIVKDNLNTTETKNFNNWFSNAKNPTHSEAWEKIKSRTHTS